MKDHLSKYSISVLDKSDETGVIASSFSSAKTGMSMVVSENNLATNDIDTGIVRYSVIPNFLCTWYNCKDSEAAEYDNALPVWRNQTRSWVGEVWVSYNLSSNIAAGSAYLDFGIKCLLAQR